MGHAHLQFGEVKKNFSHRIEGLTFGDRVYGMLYALDGEEKIAPTQEYSYQYFVQVCGARLSVYRLTPVCGFLILLGLLSVDGDWLVVKWQYRSHFSCLFVERAMFESCHNALLRETSHVTCARAARLIYPLFIKC